MTEANARFATEIEGLDTTALVVDLDVMEANLIAMAEACKRRGVALRPHVKTHKAPWIARRQLAHGAVGITAAKLGEAEAMVAGGIGDVLIAYPIVGEAKLQRLERLCLDAERILVSLDDSLVAEGIAAVGRRLGRDISVYLEVDTGLHRVGVAPERAADTAVAVDRLSGVRVEAVMTHGGHVSAATTEAQLEALAREQAETLVRTADALRRAGVEVTTVSAGSTPAARFELDTDGVTEIRPGTYVFNDANTVERFAARYQDCAAYLVATVVSRPAPDRAVVDAGSKSFGADARVGGAGPPAQLVGRSDARVVRASEEHGVLQVDPASDLAIGDRVAIVMNHVCPTVNLVDELVGVRNGRIERIIPVTARGRRT